MRHFNIGLIGCGNVFLMHGQSLVNTPGVTIRAVCDIKPFRARKAAQRYSCKAYVDYRAMLDKEGLDAVHILTPHYLHPEMVMEAAKRKINILCEKPIAIHPKDADRMIALCKKNRVQFGVISQNRCNPGSQLVKKMLTSGRLGKIKAAKLVLSYHKPDSFYMKSDWKGTWDKEGGGVLIDQAIHFVDVLHWLIDDRVEYIEANIANRMHKYMKVEDLAEGIIKYKKGAYICFYLTNYYSYDDDTEIELDCEKGRVNIVKDSARVGLYSGKVYTARPRASEYIDYGKGWKDYWGYCHCIQIKNFYRALREKRRPDIDGVEAKKTLDIVWNIYRSAKLGRRVRLI
jgi:UDP-N-acetyl-2-amino-2-deoxyglucuronate dehydrogenase